MEQNRILIIAVFLVLSLILSGQSGSGHERDHTGKAHIITVKPGTVKSADGVLIHFDTKGTGKPALVFVHGWTCNRQFWKHQVDEFAKTYQVVTLDLAGHGESGVNRENWTMAAFGEDVFAVVKALKLIDVILIGHSMGGPVIAEAAGAYRATCSRGNWRRYLA